MKIIYGQCGSCNNIAEYEKESKNKPYCKKCGSKSIWRVYTNEEIDRIMRGEKVD